MLLLSQLLAFKEIKEILKRNMVKTTTEVSVVQRAVKRLQCTSTWSWMDLGRIPLVMVHKLCV